MTFVEHVVYELSVMTFLVLIDLNITTQAFAQNSF